MNQNASLQEIVELKLVEDASLVDYQIDATNNNGIITLTGELPSEKLSQAAETLIRGLAGVVTVMNEIVVNKNAAKIKQPRQPSTVLMPK
jgi:osmotically-inducible protein OsmY